ncbi:MAG TPA: site-2 protease family protein [Chloroflexota bacterium]
MRSTFNLGRVAGIEIGIHYTWLLAFALISWSLAEGYFPTTLPHASQLTYWLMGIAGALLLVGSVLLHELSHSLVARQRGLRVDSITLFIFGGVSNLSSDATRPADEFVVAGVGPLTSLVLAGLSWALGYVFHNSIDIVAALLGYLAFANATLGVFNLVPGFPLDGGRVLRGVLWAVTGSLRKATRVASYTGQAIGYVLILLGVSSLLGGDVLSGLWIAFIGWFLSGAAESTRQEQAVREVLSGIAVRLVMNTSPPVASPRATVESFVFERAVQHGERAVLIVEAGRLLGLVTLADVKRVDRDLWATTPLAEIMSSADLQTVTPETDVATALELMTTRAIHQVPVLADGQVVGMISRAEILEMLQVRAELDLPAPRAVAG